MVLLHSDSTFRVKFTFLRVLADEIMGFNSIADRIRLFVVLLIFVFALITFLFLNGIIHGNSSTPNNLGFLLASVILWSIQTQLLPQIIANRVALIMTNRRRARYLKWGLIIIIGPINVAVGYIWTIAHLDGATPTQKHVNMVFEKAVKSFFLVIDLALNLYFLYLVRYHLIANGLDKYWRLFNFNIHLATFPEPHGITKTVETTVVVGDGESDPTFKESV
ncbi:unnamed protein product [Clonostachys rosea f. rosea IK726]|uniref:Uncharacterized protein n=1 Tax=Clonostachys rosea f. rosea IK726 TaxID=1349383 RepID=A0ACA9UK76_BIOOC|nr:unnamed protein product [Clonostachys rosea f. rosea IK726]